MINNKATIRKDGNTMNMDKLRIKKELLGILADRLFPALDSAEKDAREDYRVTGKTDVPRRHWKTNDLVFDAEGNPVYEDKWEYVTKADDELTNDDKAKLAAIEIIRTALEKLI